MENTDFIVSQYEELIEKTVRQLGKMFDFDKLEIPCWLYFLHKNPIDKSKKLYKHEVADNLVYVRIKFISTSVSKDDNGLFDFDFDFKDDSPKFDSQFEFDFREREKIRELFKDISGTWIEGVVDFDKFVQKIYELGYEFSNFDKKPSFSEIKDSYWEDSDVLDTIFITADFTKENKKTAGR